jgi:hypothetical protein
VNFSRTCLMTKGTHRCHNVFRPGGFRTQILALDAEVRDKFYFL